MAGKILIFAACLVISNARSIDEIRGVITPAADDEEHPREVLFKPNQPFKLDCDIAEDLGNLNKIDWLKDGKPLALNDNFKLLNKQKHSLIFLTPSKDAEGTYVCTAKTENGLARSQSVRVKMMYINVPKVEIKQLTPVEGEPFQLECPQVDAYPKPEIVWMKQLVSAPVISHTILDRRINAAPNGNLYFSSITDEDVDDDFKYACMASHPALKRPVSLADYVIGSAQKNSDKKPKLVEQYLSKDLVVKEGDVAMIYCIWGGTPLAHPDWFFNGIDTNGDPKDRITRHNRSSGKRLLIKQTRLTDQGTYRCQVVKPDDNSITGHDLKLTVVSPPAFIQKPLPKMAAKEGSDVSIPCQIKGVPSPKLTWTFNGQPLKTGDRLSVNIDDKQKDVKSAELRIKKVQKADRGYYGCGATSEYGDIYAESLVTVV